MTENHRTARAETTRRQLLDAARTVFAERGYGATTVAAVTEVANTAHGTFYLYFRNKEDAFVQVISDVTEELYRHSFTPVEELPEGVDPGHTRERIAGFLRVFVTHGRLWRAMLEGALASRAVEEHWRAERKRFHQTIETRLERFRRLGLLRPVDPAVTAHAMASMMEWFAFTSMAFDEVEIDDHVIDTLTELWLRATVASP